MVRSRHANETLRRYDSHKRILKKWLSDATIKVRYPQMYGSAGHFRLALLTADIFLDYLAARALGKVPGHHWKGGVGCKSLGNDKSALLYWYSTVEVGSCVRATRHLLSLCLHLHLHLLV
jgi:hypothetical protein